MIVKLQNQKDLVAKLENICTLELRSHYSKNIELFDKFGIVSMTFLYDENAITIVSKICTNQYNITNPQKYGFYKTNGIYKSDTRIVGNSNFIWVVVDKIIMETLLEMLKQ